LSEQQNSFRTGADLVVACLVEEQVSHVFGLPGTTIMDLIDSLARQADIRYMSVRHEQVAGFMADGYSRAGGGLGVCLVSRGPGAANLSIAVQNAHDESIPMLVLIGQIPSGITERRAFEEMDAVSSFAPFSKWAVEVHHADRIPELLQRAIRTATTGRPGPVVVSLPLDVLQASTQAVPAARVRSHPPVAHPAGVAEAVALLADAQRPVIILGGGAGAGNSAAFERLAECSSTPVVTTWLRKNVFPNGHANFVGSLGYGAFDLSDDVVREADVILAFGCRFSEFTTKRWTLLSGQSSLVHVDVDPLELGRIYPPTVGLVSDASAAAAAMAEASQDPTGDGARGARLADLRDQYLKAAAGATAAGTGSAQPDTVSSPAVVAGLQRLADRQGVVLVQDVHSFGPWIQRFVEMKCSRSYYGSAGGAMAWGFPAAMGMALARPDDRIVSISGDGSFWMVAQDFETCVRERIPVVNVVINNYAYGNTRDRQRFAHDERYLGVFLGNPDFGAYARLLGGHGEQVTHDADLWPAIEAALAQEGPSIIDVVQDEMEGLPAGLTPLRAR
jgi:acetolactate synthase-1/2/3 large subunit